MIYRVYVRWPNQRVSDKTTTVSKTVAKFAFDELVGDKEAFSADGALGISMSLDGKQLDYFFLNEDTE